MSFWEEAVPYALQAHAETGVLTSVILAQWADESAFGGPDWSVYHNPGNVGDTSHGGQVTYPNLQTGVNAYIHTMLLPYYTAVRNGVGYVAQTDALGQSPWAAGHYGSPPGSDLLAIIHDYDLTQYDDGNQPVPIPPVPPLPLPIQEDTMSITALPNGGVAISAVGTGSRNDHLLVFTLANPTNPTNPGYNVLDVTAGIGTANPFTVQSA